VRRQRVSAAPVPTTIERDALEGAVHHERRAVGAVRWDWISSNPAAVARKPRQPTPQPKPPTSEQAEKIITAAWGQDADWGTLIWLVMVTGVRRAGLLALRWSDVDLTSATSPSVAISLRLKGREGRQDPTKFAAFRWTPFRDGRGSDRAPSAVLRARTEVLHRGDQRGFPLLIRGRARSSLRSEWGEPALRAHVWCELRTASGKPRPPRFRAVDWRRSHGH
jgi:integrase